MVIILGRAMLVCDVAWSNCAGAGSRSRTVASMVSSTYGLSTRDEMPGPQRPIQRYAKFICTLAAQRALERIAYSGL
jgi:hypothetical protein